MVKPEKRIDWQKVGQKIANDKKRINENKNSAAGAELGDIKFIVPDVLQPENKNERKES